MTAEPQTPLQPTLQPGLNTQHLQGIGRVITDSQATKAEEAKLAHQLQEPAKQLTAQQKLLKVQLWLLSR